MFQADIKDKGVVEPVKGETDIVIMKRYGILNLLNQWVPTKYGTTVHQWITKQATRILSTKADVAISDEINEKLKTLIWDKAEDKSILLITGAEDYQY